MSSQFSSDTQLNLPLPTQLRNKSPSTVQIAAEQILRDARERRDSEIRATKQKTDSTFLVDDHLRERNEIEDQISRFRCNTSIWIEYAQWEESRDLNRARSVWERAVDEVDYRNYTLWLKYAEMEIRNNCIDNARNILNRAFTKLPRVDKLWCEYTQMEEKLGNLVGARQVFEHWMSWMPDEQGWLSYIKFELRHGEIERARGIFERGVQFHPKVSLRWRMEKWLGPGMCMRERLRNPVTRRGRSSYLRRLLSLRSSVEIEHARCIYKFGLDHLPKMRTEDLYKKFLAFESRCFQELMNQKFRKQSNYNMPCIQY